MSAVFASLFFLIPVVATAAGWYFFFKDTPQPKKLNTIYEKYGLPRPRSGFEFRLSKDWNGSSFSNIDLYHRDRRIAMETFISDPQLPRVAERLLKSTSYLNEIKKLSPENMMKRIPLKKIELPDDVLAKATTDSKGELVIPEARQFQVPYLPVGLKWNISSDEQGGVLKLVDIRKPKRPKVLVKESMPETRNISRTILETAFILLEQADYEYGEKMQIYYEKPKTAFSDFEGDF